MSKETDQTKTVTIGDSNSEIAVDQSSTVIIVNMNSTAVKISQRAIDELVNSYNAIDKEYDLFRQQIIISTENRLAYFELKRLGFVEKFDTLAVRGYYITEEGALAAEEILANEQH